jgi:hypothetical protein
MLSGVKSLELHTQKIVDRDDNGEYNYCVRNEQINIKELSLWIQATVARVRAPEVRA